MWETLKNFYHRYLTHPQAALLLFSLLALTLMVLFAGKILAPFLAALVLAYLLEGLVGKLQGSGPESRRGWALFIVLTFFLVMLCFVALVLMPLLMVQVGTFIQQLPEMVTSGLETLRRLPERYPEFITEEQLQKILTTLSAELTTIGQGMLQAALGAAGSLVTLIIYLVVVPLMMLYLLKDKQELLSAFGKFLPRNRSVLNQVWRELDSQLGNYIRGKCYEILIVALASYLLFASLGLDYTPLLAVLVGLSVVIPYVGAFVITVPVVLAGYFQWGLESEFYFLIIGHIVIQVLDGNLLVPWLFSKAVKLHPLAILMAILLFGSLWGFWGVFFAIPLATLIKAVFNAWPAKGSESGATAP